MWNTKKIILIFLFSFKSIFSDEVDGLLYFYTPDFNKQFEKNGNKIILGKIENIYKIEEERQKIEIFATINYSFSGLLKGEEKVTIKV
jgi:hypothetical protein